MEPETRYTVIGAVVLALIGAAVFGYLWLSSSGRASDYRFYTVYFEHQSLEGLQIGGNVDMRGISVGRVEDYSLSRDDINRVKVTLRLLRDTPVRENTRASVSRNVLTGIARIKLATPNVPAPDLVKAPAGERYPVIGEGVSGFDQITDTATRLAQVANTTLDRVNQLLNEDNQKVFAQLLVGMRDLSTGLSARLDTMEKTVAQVGDTAVAFRQSAREITASVQSLLTSMEPLPGEASQTLQAARDAVQQITRSTQALERDLAAAVSRLEQNSVGLVKRADDALDIGVLELRASAVELRSSAELMSRALDRLQDPRAALLGPGERQMGPGEQAP